MVNFFYPVRQQMNRAIIYTDLEEMMALGHNQDNLFHKWDVILKQSAKVRRLKFHAAVTRIQATSDRYKFGHPVDLSRHCLVSDL